MNYLNNKIMKKLLLTIFIVLLNTLGYSQDTIKNGLFEIVYSETLQQPLYVKYKVLCPEGEAKREGMNFYKPDSIETSDYKDYYKNPWDRGHMIPANSFNCSEDTLYKTFSYLNVALQHYSLNRGVWKDLEEFEQQLSLKFDVEVEIFVDFIGEHRTLPTGAVIPYGFKKIIKFKGKKMVFYFPNEKPSKEVGWLSYRIR